jgi:hypothetical protein
MFKPPSLFSSQDAGIGQPVIDHAKFLRDTGVSVFKKSVNSQATSIFGCPAPFCRATCRKLIENTGY